MTIAPYGDDGEYDLSNRMAASPLCVQLVAYATRISAGPLRRLMYSFLGVVSV